MSEKPTKLPVQLRRVEAFGLGRNGPPRRNTVTEDELDLAKTAVVVVDMWDAHWCKTFTRRVGELVPRMNPALDAARAIGLPVIFAPSDVLALYRYDPRR